MLNLVTSKTLLKDIFSSLFAFNVFPWRLYQARLHIQKLLNRSADIGINNMPIHSLRNFVTGI